MNDTDTESGLVFLKLTIPEPRLGLEPLKVRDFNETRPRREVSEYPDLQFVDNMLLVGTGICSF